MKFHVENVQSLKKHEFSPTKLPNKSDDSEDDESDDAEKRLLPTYTATKLSKLSYNFNAQKKQTSSDIGNLDEFADDAKTRNAMLTNKMIQQFYDSSAYKYMTASSAE